MNTEARRLRVTVAIAMVAMVTGLETAASAYGRNIAAGGGPAWVAWKRTRRLAPQPFDQTAINRAMLYDDIYRGEEDHIHFPNDDDDDVYHRRSQFPDPRGRNGPSRGQPLGRNPSPRSKSYSDSARFLVRPDGRRKRRRQEGRTPDWSPGFVAPFSRSLRRWKEENPVDGGRPITTFGSRKIVRTPRARGWRGPTQDPWKRLHSMGDSPRNDFEAPKRQPPPGFHAIRGKRNSESENENETYSLTDNETEAESEPETEIETGEEASYRRLMAALGDPSIASF